jgi:serine/threonine protein kinase
MAFYPPGTRIAGRYEVAGQPLMGGMGIVYLCFDHEEQRPLALKTFRPEFLSDRDVRARFLEECHAWVRLGQHPHIVRCYEVFQDSPRPEVYLALELVAKEEGRQDASLRAWLTPGRPLPLDQTLLIALQIARGMIHATAAIPGFVHRDLKPENVLVGADRLSNAAINRSKCRFPMIARHSSGLQGELKPEQAHRNTWPQSNGNAQT